MSKEFQSSKFKVQNPKIKATSKNVIPAKANPESLEITGLPPARE